MDTLIAKITSRKFLLAVAGLITLAANRQWTEFVLVLMGYLGIEGGADVVGRVRGDGGA